MPKLSKSVPAYRLHRATRQAVVTINGRDHYLGPHRSKASLVEYDRLISEWLASGRSASYGKPEASLSIAELLAAYLAHAKGYYGEGSRGEYANMIVAVRPLKELYSRQPADSFGPLELKAIRQRFIDAGHCRSNINANVRRVVRVFRWAASEALLPPTVAQSLAMVPGLRRGRSEAPEGKKVRPVEAEIVEATLPHLSPTVRAMVELQLLTGMRPGELVIMRPADIDRTGEVWEYRPRQHKNIHRDMDRVVYLGPKAQDILRPFLLRPAESFCFSPAEAEAKRRAELSARRTTPLSCGNRVGTNRVRKPRRKPGDFYPLDSYRWAIYRACDAAFPPPDHLARRDGESVKRWQERLSEAERKELAAWQSAHRWSMNQLRHSLATKVRRKFDLESAKVLLGHSDLNTSGIYAEQDRKRAVEVAKLIG